MSDQPEETIVRDLADVVGELTRRHAELLSSLRSLREDLQWPRRGGDDDQPPPPRLSQPPARPEGAASHPPAEEAVWASRVSHVTPLPTVNGVHHPGSAGDRPSGFLHLVERGGLAHPLTKRHYDYFAELDDLLARLPVTRPTKPKAPFDH
jgi:hypothetical protein